MRAYFKLFGLGRMDRVTLLCAHVCVILLVGAWCVNGSPITAGMRTQECLVDKHDFFIARLVSTYGSHEHTINSVAHDLHKVIKESPRVVCEVPQWVELLGALIEAGALDRPRMHSIFLSHACPTAVFRTYVKRLLGENESWMLKWTCTGMHGVSSPMIFPDADGYLSAFDMLLLNGPVDHLGVVLVEFPELAWPYLREALRDDYAHPMRTLEAAALFPREMLDKAVLLWKFIAARETDADVLVKFITYRNRANELYQSGVCASLIDNPIADIASAAVRAAVADRIIQTGDTTKPCVHDVQHNNPRAPALTTRVYWQRGSTYMEIMNKPIYPIDDDDCSGEHGTSEVTLLKYLKVRNKRSNLVEPDDDDHHVFNKEDDDMANYNYLSDDLFFKNPDASPGYHQYQPKPLMLTNPPSRIATMHPYASPYKYRPVTYTPLFDHDAFNDTASS